MIRSRPFWIAILMLMLVGLACLLVSQVPAHAQAIAYRVIDGDTVERDGITYRLMNYDTPETFFAQCKAEKLLGIQAKLRLEQLLSFDGAVKIQPTGLKDRYKRSLAVLLVGEEPVSQIMIREGLAVPYICPKNRCPRRINWCVK